MQPTRNGVRIVALAFILSLFSGCGDTDSPAPDSAVHRQETMVNEVDGAVWMACAVGQTWVASTGGCTGEPAAIPCEETATACPEGFELPTKDNFQNALCGLIGSMDTVCPTDRFRSCAECDVCTDLFGQDSGRYPIREGHVSNDMYIGEVVNFETGCSESDGFPDTLCNVRCVAVEQDSSTDTGKPTTCAETTTREACEGRSDCLTLLGNPVDETQSCTSPESTFLACLPAVDCNTALGYARDPETGVCYQFPSLCFPTGWTESSDCGAADTVCDS